MSDSAYLGIDVGTGSVRAGIFSATGKRLGYGDHAIRIWRPEADFVEQSSDDIWQACAAAVRGALTESGLAPEAISGISFDATCSLVALDAGDQPMTVSPTGEDARNVIVWMDHRAIEQAERINRAGHEVLQYVGGVISPEMETPKLLWLKENLPDSWKRTARFLDLADFLTYRATGDDSRSLCTTVCKWTYLGHREGGGWDTSYFEQIGLDDLAAEQFRRIGAAVKPMGTPAGSGLTETAATELGLAPGTPVGIGIIDAHAGGIGMIGLAVGDEPVSFDRRLALIGGTSSCHMAVSPEARFVPGVWGPYYSAMIPRLWLTEGGQSATGALIDHVIQDHADYPALEAESRDSQKSVYELLNAALDDASAAVDFPAAFTRDFHLLPDFHGNRSPRADPTLKGIVAGLTLEQSRLDHARRYLAAVQGVAYGTRHIIEALNAQGYAVDTLITCGGGTRNPVFLREHADATDCRIILPDEPEAVLLGGAMLGAVAAGAFPDIPAAMAAMSRPGHVIEPAGGVVKAYHDSKYKVFHRMHEDFLAYREIMTRT